MPDSDLLRSALAHATRGWRVFPLRPNDKRPAVRDWEARATSDEARILKAWSKGRFNIGLACGPSGLVVIDLDTPAHGAKRPSQWDRPGINDGADVLAALADEAEQPAPFETLSVQTASLIYGSRVGSPHRQHRAVAVVGRLGTSALSRGAQRRTATAMPSRVGEPR